jgi:RNA polymerase sigma-70 factor (ECF subfamily)
MSDHAVVRHWPPGPPTWVLTVVTPDGPPAADPSETLAQLPDAELVSRCLGGQPEAFDVIVSRHRRAVYQVCYRFVRHHEDAADLAQDVFLRAWRGLPRFKGESAFSTWIYRIAVNACLNRVSVKGVTVEPLAERDCYEDTRAERPGSDLFREERADAVRRAIQALPARQRATLVLRIYHDLPHQQIAEVLGSSVGAVKANFFHALGNLKKILGREP